MAATQMGKHLRVFPALVVDKVFKLAFPVVGILMSQVEDLGIIEELLVEAEDLLFLGVQRGRHLEERKDASSQTDDEAVRLVVDA